MKIEAEHSGPRHLSGLEGIAVSRGSTVFTLVLTPMLLLKHLLLFFLALFLYYIEDLCIMII